MINSYVLEVYLSDICGYTERTHVSWRRL